jgi:CheY-like chemotaxis protein
MTRYVRLALESTRSKGDWPIEVEGLTSGGALVERVAQTNGDGHAPDLVLLDLKLGDMSGLDALAEMQRHERWRATPVFLVTAANLTEEVVGQTRDAIRASMSRPLTADEMGAALNALLTALKPTMAATATAPARREGPPA